MKKIFFIVIILISCVVLYGFFINPNGFKVSSESIEIEGLSESFDGFKILQLSDFLIKDKNDLSRIEKIVKKVNDLKPDIIVFTGDLIYKGNNLNNDDIKKIKEILKKLECTLYKYAVYGDNDDENIIAEALKDADFKILDNESSYIFYKDVKPIKITGLSNLDNVSKALSIEDNLDTTLNLVITHYPDYFDTLKNENVDVVLAGHSLNGQVVMPFYGGIIKSNNARKYIYKYYDENDTKLYISGGIGTKKVEFRLFNKSEINIYKIKRK